MQKCNKKCKGGQKTRISDAKIRFFSVFLGFFARFFRDILAKSSGFFGKKFWQHWSDSVAKKELEVKHQIRFILAIGIPRGSKGGLE